MAWILILIAIALEVAATLCLKATEGLSRPLPLVGVVIGYIASFALMGVALRSLPVGPVYAVWAALGTAGAVVGGALLFRERLSPLGALGVIVVVTGVVLIGIAERAP